MTAKRKTTTSWEVKERWNRANYVRITAAVPKELGKRFKAKCLVTNTSQAQVIKGAIENFLGDE